jgi:urease accessory protein
LRTVVEVVARCGPGGRTVLPVLRAGGALAVRATGAGMVHLVGTAAGPLGGDSVELVVRVEAGASLTLRSVAASVVLPARTGLDSVTTVTVDVAPGGQLDLGLSPTVVTARAAHRTSVHAAVAEDAALRLTEQVVLGRAGEGPGRWTGTVRVERAGTPILHTSQELGPGGAGWAAPFTPRAYASELVLDGGDHSPAVGTDAVRLPLPGGWTATAWADQLDTCLAALHPAQLVGAR